MASDADPLRKSVLVTGGSGGVGAAICSLLADCQIDRLMPSRERMASATFSTTDRSLKMLVR